MKLNHPAITGELFRLVDVYEFGMTLGPEDDADSFTVQLELFRSMSEDKHYKCKALRSELVHLTPTFPFVTEDDHGSVEESRIDDDVMVSFNMPGMELLASPFEADSPEEAFKKVMDALDNFMEHVSRRRISFS